MFASMRRTGHHSRARSLARSLAGALPSGILRWLGRVQFKVPALRRLSGRLVPELIAGVSTISHGPARGLRIDAAGAHPGYALGTSEPLLQETVVDLLHTGDVFYDLGANVGFFTLLAAQLVGPDGAVVAFEPDPRNAETLRFNVGLNGFANVAVIELGVSDTTGRRRFVIAESTASHFAESADHEMTTLVDVVNLDAFVSRGGHRPPTVLKLDIEGDEAKALRGAEQLIARHRPAIVCEVHGTEGEVRELLHAAGYRLRTLEEGQRSMPWNCHILAMSS
jgi:FkbM family methyltransferase